MDKCFENKFVTVAEHRFVWIHAGSAEVHSAAVAEQSVGAEYVRAEEAHLIVTVLQYVQYLCVSISKVFAQTTLSQLQLQNCKDKE